MGKGWLLDTNVISELRRPRPSAHVVAFVVAKAQEDLFVSEVTLAELRFGIDSLKDPAKRADLNEWLAHQVRPMFSQRTLPVSEDVMLRWRVLVEQGRKAGHTFSQPDLIIAATALQHGLTLVTRDTKDYERAGVILCNPWLDDLG
jgi:toxin FitB